MCSALPVSEEFKNRPNLVVLTFEPAGSALACVSMRACYQAWGLSFSPVGHLDRCSASTLTMILTTGCANLSFASSLRLTSRETVCCSADSYRRSPMHSLSVATLALVDDNTDPGPCGSKGNRTSWKSRYQGMKIQAVIDGNTAVLGAMPLDEFTSLTDVRGENACGVGNLALTISISRACLLVLHVRLHP